MELPHFPAEPTTMNVYGAAMREDLQESEPQGGSQNQ
jgi:hypothetical protein